MKQTHCRKLKEINIVKHEQSRIPFGKALHGRSKVFWLHRWRWVFFLQFWYTSILKIPMHAQSSSNQISRPALTSTMFWTATSKTTVIEEMNPCQTSVWFTRPLPIRIICFSHTMGPFRPDSHEFAIESSHSVERAKMASIEFWMP